MPYTICKSIDIDFSHHIRGHAGACINLHGHTWKFEVCLAADELDAEGFVVDFKRLKTLVLKPCHALLDHSLAVGEQTWREIGDDLARVGAGLLASRDMIGEPGREVASAPDLVQLPGARNELAGGMKVAVFVFSPTSERLAKWLHDLAVSTLEDERVRVQWARVYETLHPVESVAAYQR